MVRAMAEDHPAMPSAAEPRGERLDSWKEIAAYLKRDVRTVQRWEETGGLPVHRHAQGRSGHSPVYAYKSELDDWLRQGPPPPVGKEERPPPAVKARRILWAAVPVLILAAAGIVWRFVPSKPPAPPVRVVQLTSYPGLE